jgi:uncharacterized protein (TIGR00369 family)
MLARIPYAQFLGMRAELAGDEMTAILPYSEHLIGNPTLPAIHGGVLGAFMELTALTQLAIAQESSGERMARQPKPIDVTVEYLRSGKPIDTFARAQITRMGRRIANVRVEAWQSTRAAPIAALHGHFLLTLAEEAPA